MATTTTVITTATATTMAATRMFYRPTTAAAAATTRGVAPWPRAPVALIRTALRRAPDPDGSDWDEIPAPALLCGMHAPA